jgi:hypothetical protein
VVAGEEGQRTLQFFASRVEGNLLAAHQVDRVVKGLSAKGWPNDNWLALQRLAWQMGQMCAGAVATSR